MRFSPDANGGVCSQKLGEFLDRNKIFKITHFFAKVILKQGLLFRREIEDAVYTCLLMPHFAVGSTYVPTVRRCVLCRIKNAILEIGNHMVVFMVYRLVFLPESLHGTRPL